MQATLHPCGHARSDVCLLLVEDLYLQTRLKFDETARHLQMLESNARRAVCAAVKEFNRNQVPSRGAVPTGWMGTLGWLDPSLRVPSLPLPLLRWMALGLVCPLALNQQQKLET